MRARRERFSFRLISRGYIGCEGIFAFALVFGGCVGDFGRPRPSIFGDSRATRLGIEAAHTLGEPASIYPLTEEEHLMRELAYNLIRPPYDRARWHVVLFDYARTGVAPVFGPDVRNVYGPQLISWYPSATARYARLTDDIRNDIVRIDPFAFAAGRVIDLDRKRDQSLAYVTTVAAYEVVNAQRRIAENALIVDWVRWCLTERAAAYRFALERLVIALPSPAAVEAERALGELEQRIGVMIAPRATLVVK
jgi:hypothetical protein